jgi:integrase
LGNDERLQARGKEVTMSLFRYKGSKVWTMDFQFRGQRIRETTGTSSKTLAAEIQRKRRRDLEEGAAGIKKRQQPRLLSIAAEAWIESKQRKVSVRSIAIERANLKHILPELGRNLVTDIEAKDISRYQKKRLDEGASPKTVNLEIATLRAILKRHGAWASLQPEVTMLTVHDDVGKALTADEERALLVACGKSRSRSLLPFVTLLIETGARYNTVRTLRWKNIDFDNRCLQFGKDKTANGSGRFVPLNPRATSILGFWATNFPGRKPEHYVFPSERFGLDGEAGYLRGEVVPYNTDPNKPMGSWKTAWQQARKNAGMALAGSPEKTDDVPPLACRFHDCRHTAVSRMLDAGTPLPKVAKIVGWSPATMVRMAARYGHFALEELRGAVESISRSGIPTGSPVFSPVSEEASRKRSN